MELGSTELT